MLDLEVNFSIVVLSDKYLKEIFKRIGRIRRSKEGINSKSGTCRHTM